MQAKFLADETLSKKLITKGFRVYLFSYLIAPSGYILKLLVTNTLSVEDVGFFYASMGLISLIGAYNDFGCTESLQYFLPRLWLEKKMKLIRTSIRISVCIQLTTAFLLFLLFFFGAEFLITDYFYRNVCVAHMPVLVDMLQLLGVYFFFINALSILQSIFIGFQDVFWSKCIEFVRMWTSVLVLALFIVTDLHSLDFIAGAWTIGLIAGCLLALYVALRSYYTILFPIQILYDRSFIKKYLTFSFWIFLGMNASTLLAQIDQQMIVYSLGPIQAGLYTVYLSGLMIPFLILSPILHIIFPIISELFKKGSYKQLDGLLSFFTNYFMIIAILGVVILYTVGQNLLMLLFGSVYSSSGVLLQLGVWLIPIQLAVGISFAYLSGVGEVRLKVVLLFIAALLNIVGNLLLIPSFGIVGAIIATYISSAFLGISGVVYMMRDRVIHFDRIFLVKNIIYIVCVMLTIGGLFRYIDTTINIYMTSSYLYQRYSMILTALLVIVGFIVINVNKILVLYKQFCIYIKK